MGSHITPMIHVPDVHKTAAWYEAIGFTLVNWHGRDADGLRSGPLPPPTDIELDWALVRWGDDNVMLNAGGTPSEKTRRDVDLYINLHPASAAEGVDALFVHLQEKTEIIEAPYDAFHGNRELIVRDPNGFWITFAEPVGRNL